MGESTLGVVWSSSEWKRRKWGLARTVVVKSQGREVKNPLLLCFRIFTGEGWIFWLFMRMQICLSTAHDLQDLFPTYSNTHTDTRVQIDWRCEKFMHGKLIS